MTDKPEKLTPRAMLAYYRKQAVNLPENVREIMEAVKKLSFVERLELLEWQIVHQTIILQQMQQAPTTDFAALQAERKLS